MRLQCSPAARATATGAHESHSYCPPEWAYISDSPRTTDMAFAPAEPISTSSAPSSSATARAAFGGRLRLTIIRGGVWPVSGICIGSAVRFRKFASAVNGVDNPGSVGTESLGSVFSFFAQDGVIGANATKLFHDELVRSPIALVFHFLRFGAASGHFVTNRDKKFTRRGGDAFCLEMVVMGHSCHRGFQPRIR